MIGERSRVSTFVVLQATRIPDAKRVHCSRILPRRQRCDRTRIETTTQCDPHRHVRTNHDLANGFKLLADQHRRIAFDRRLVFRSDAAIALESRPPLNAIPTGTSERITISLTVSSCSRINIAGSPSIGGSSSIPQYLFSLIGHGSTSTISNDAASSLRTPLNGVSGSGTY